MRRERGPINARIIAIANEGSGNRRREDVGARDAAGSPQRLALSVSVSGLGRQVVPSTGTKIGTGTAFGVVSSGLASLSLASPSSSLPPSPELSPSPLSAISPASSSSSPTKLTLSKVRKRAAESRSKWSLYGFHRRWWQRTMSKKKNKKYFSPHDHILSSCLRRLQRINQLIASITKKHQILRYDRIAEKYLHWENHLREQMILRRWGTKKNVELDRERRADLVRLEYLQRRRDALVRMVSARRG